VVLPASPYGRASILIPPCGAWVAWLLTDLLSGVA
jgi:hypothetical protein